MLGKELHSNIDNLFNSNYVVPLYQRNYAWGEEEIFQLLQDIYESFVKSKKQGQYFIGSLVVLRRKDGQFEVIDGQQRLITISLIAKILSPQKYKVPKLHFDSRPEVEAFLQNFYSTGEMINTTNSHLISHFKKAVEYINTTDLDVRGDKKLILSELISFDQSFKNYFFNNVIIVKVEIPNDTDVAHYFEVMNNRGEQLEKHEILKARLLDKIKNDDTSSLIFSEIWDACSQMNIPIQRSFNVERRKQIFGYNNDNFVWEFDNDKTIKYSGAKERNKFTIDEIIADNSINVSKEEKENEVNFHYSSILDFPNFLMHVLKLTENQYNIDVPLNGDELLDTFSKIKEIDSMKFIKDLLFYRVVFDRFIIKTFEDENEEDNYKWILEKPVYYSEYNKLDFVNSFHNQSKIIKCLSMLQVTFRTKKYKTWVQSVLSWFKDEDSLNISEGEYIKKLHQLVLNRYDKSEFAKIIDNNETYAEGTKTPHYLFNFLDYLLWLKKPKEFNFEFKYRNSVEHHLPQSSRNDENLNVDHFANLCLVSKGGNSKMNNENPVGKATKENGKFYKDTLPPKQKIMYDLTNRQNAWGKLQLEEHYNTIIKILEDRKYILNYE